MRRGACDQQRASVTLARAVSEHVENSLMVKRLNAAEGFLQLGMPEDGWNELEEIEPELRHLPDVMVLRVDILNALKRWEAATIIGQGAI